MSSTFQYAFSVWPENDIIPTHLHERYNGFYIRIGVCYMVEQRNHNLAIVNSFIRSFPIRRQNFVDEGLMIMLLTLNLRQANTYLPEDIEDEIVNQVSNLGRSMMSDASNALKILSILVDSRITTLQQPDEDEDEAIDRTNRAIQANREPMEVSALRPMPVLRPVPAFRPVIATKSFSQVLEKTTLDDSCSLKELCAICLEKLSVGLEIIRIPCSHIYHGDCIVKWLERSNLCPLCRFAMPR